MMTSANRVVGVGTVGLGSRCAEDNKNMNHEKFRSWLRTKQEMEAEQPPPEKPICVPELYQMRKEQAVKRSYQRQRQLEKISTTTLKERAEIKKEIEARKAADLAEARAAAQEARRAAQKKHDQAKEEFEEFRRKSIMDVKVQTARERMIWEDIVHQDEEEEQAARDFNLQWMRQSREMALQEREKELAARAESIRQQRAREEEIKSRWRMEKQREEEALKQEAAAQRELERAAVRRSRQKHEQKVQKTVMDFRDELQKQKDAVSARREARQQMLLTEVHERRERSQSPHNAVDEARQQKELIGDEVRERTKMARLQVEKERDEIIALNSARRHEENEKRKQREAKRQQAPLTART